MSIPTEEVAVPPIVERLAAGRPLRPAWANGLGGLTFQIGTGPEREFIKWCPPHPEFDLEQEAIKLRWAGRYITVPTVITVDADEAGSWLHTEGVPGSSAVAPPWSTNPQLAVRAIGRGLRALHDRLPVAQCPFSWSLEDRFTKIKKAKDRALIQQAPPIDQLVVCHGDSCAPNTLVDDNGGWSGHVDLGSLGLGDRWADLAIASYSLPWNFTGKWEGEFFTAYGINPDPARINYYRRLWDAT